VLGSRLGRGEEVGTSREDNFGRKTKASNFTKERKGRKTRSERLSRTSTPIEVQCQIVLIAIPDNTIMFLWLGVFEALRS
jgi:hypothetical protein